MKPTAMLCLFSAAIALGQGPAPKGFFATLPVKASVGANSPLNSGVPLPMFTYNLTAYDGKPYTGTIIGRSPFSHGKTTTTIPTQIIPLIITINDGTTTVTYDPTINDPCVTPGTHTDVEVITSSPIFTNNPWTMNGENLGSTQYIDAFQRSEFSSLVTGTPYHLILSPTTLNAQSLSFDLTKGSNFTRPCGKVGVININDLDAAVQGIITGPLSGLINVGTFPIFLTKNVVTAITGHSLFSSCCVLGYHSGLNVGANLQIYSPFSLDTSGTFGGDVSTLSHEMGEAINDPRGNNPTPPWGNIGQVQGGCQGNFETGDPLSPGFPPPVSNSFVVAGANGLSYHLQEQAYFSWFYGGTNLGVAGKFSNNGTFTGFAKACPPGGTN